MTATVAAASEIAKNRFLFIYLPSRYRRRVKHPTIWREEGHGAFAVCSGARENHMRGDSPEAASCRRLALAKFGTPGHDKNSSPPGDVVC
jgi:hypothetical protein